MRRKERFLPHLRRGAALALALVGVWIFGLTVPSGDVLATWGEDTALVTALLEVEMGGESWWQTLLLSQSPQLAAASNGVTLRLSAQESASDSTQSPSVSPAQGEEDAEQRTGEAPIAIQGEDDDVIITDAALPLGEVVEYTAVGDDGGNYLLSDEVYLSNRTTQWVDLEDVVAAAAMGTLTLDDQGEEPQILIIHTHATEAYTPTGEEDTYLESDPYRTTDCNYNIVRVGAEMAAVFRDQGFVVIHDTTLYDYPDYNSSYANARQGVEDWLEQYPSITLILDVHRDALVTSDGTPYRLVTQEDGQTMAQVMVVVGSDDDGAYSPNWRENLALAVEIQLQLTADYTSLARPITLRSSRFNQDLSTGFLLVEVGGHGNTLADALAAAQAFSTSVCQVLLDS